MKTEDINNLTPHQDVNDLLTMLSKGLQDILRVQLIGVYLTGSLTYGDFDRGSSDIDLLIVLNNALSEVVREQVKNLHAQIAMKYPFWAKRIEASYITEDMMKYREPPEQPRPYINGGQMWDPDPPYGNEWLINLYVLYECGVVLYGPDPKTLIGHSIEIETLRKASQDDLHQDWEPLLKDPSPLEDPHFQAYAVMTLCRILYRAKNDDVTSKRVASTWVKKTYGERWSNLIIQAENWSHGDEMNATNEVLQFIEFVLEEEDIVIQNTKKTHT